MPVSPCSTMTTTVASTSFSLTVRRSPAHAQRDSSEQDWVTIPESGCFHQKPDGTFEEVSAKAGLQGEGYGMGVAVGDYDTTVTKISTGPPPDATGSTTTMGTARSPMLRTKRASAVGKGLGIAYRRLHRMAETQKALRRYQAQQDSAGTAPTSPPADPPADPK
jgi:hypothetical protein